ncbi:transposase [Nonomuraea phyllanthi]|uniref:transposase n=1 Tax=Nonomuraea phyllanthi TaxID=2219224 RepID=UPI001D0032C9
MRGKWHGTTGYPPEFRRKVLDLLEAGRTATEMAHDLDISTQTIYTWRRQTTHRRAGDRATGHSTGNRAGARGGAPKDGSRPSRWWPAKASPSKSPAASWLSRCPGTTPGEEGRPHRGPSGTSG